MMFTDLKKENTKLYVNLFGVAGCGKTYSSMLIGTTLASANDKVLIIDTESRASIYANDFVGLKTFKEPNITIGKIINVIDEARKQKFEVIIIDSLTPLWDGQDGLATNALKDVNNKHGKNWQKPKQLITAFTQLLKNCGMHVITTSLGKHEVDSNMNKTEIIEPIFERPKFEPYLDIQILLNSNGKVGSVIKGMHKEIQEKIVKHNQITVDLIKEIKDWIGGDTNLINNNTYTEFKQQITNIELIEQFVNATKNLNSEELKKFETALSEKEKKLYLHNLSYIKEQRNLLENTENNLKENSTIDFEQTKQKLLSSQTVNELQVNFKYCSENKKFFTKEQVDELTTIKNTMKNELEKV
jgi:hypothetical protein